MLEGMSQAVVFCLGVAVGLAVLPMVVVSAFLVGEAVLERRAKTRELSYRMDLWD